MLSSYLSLGLPSSFVPSGYYTKASHAFLLSLRCMIYDPLSSSAFTIIITLNILKLLIMLRSPTFVTSPPPRPNILLGALFSHTVSLFSSFNLRDQLYAHRKEKLQFNILILMFFRYQSGRQIIFDWVVVSILDRFLLWYRTVIKPDKHQHAAC
jgi:hypothetical protein